MRVPAGVFPFVHLDGAIVAAEHAVVSVFDRGFLVADGIFETLYVTRGTAIEVERHLERLEGSASYIRLEGLPPRRALLAALDELLVANGLHGPGGGEASIRLTVSRGVTVGDPPTVVIFARSLAESHLRKRREGVLGFTLPIARGAAGRDLAQHKTLAYLASSLGQLMLVEHTADPRTEGFFVDEQGRLLEGTASNLFIVEEGEGEQGRLVTPPLELGILPGTSRAVVLELAPQAGLDAVEEPITPARLMAAAEVFITSSTLRVAPVISLDGRPVGGGRPGPVVERLQALFEARVEAEVAHRR